MVLKFSELFYDCYKYIFVHINYRKIAQYDFFTDWRFEKQESQYCTTVDVEYCNYTTLNLAQSACSSNENCKAVFDDRCDNRDRFCLCLMSSTFEKSEQSCVYKKFDNDVQIIEIIE